MRFAVADKLFAERFAELYRNRRRGEAVSLAERCEQLASKLRKGVITDVALALICSALFVLTGNVFCLGCSCFIGGCITWLVRKSLALEDVAIALRAEGERLG